MTDPITYNFIEANRVILPIFIELGVVGNSFNIVVLTRPTLSRHACSHYFFALSCDNLFVSSIVLIQALLADGYQFDVTTISSVSYKMLRFLIDLSSAISPYFIVLASIDRFAILVLVSFFTLFLIGNLVLIRLDLSDGRRCALCPDSLYSKVYPIIQIVLFSL
jgi:hypothetical protein